MDFSEAFVLWRGLDINYTGGVLEHPARVAIHFTHRLGAVVATLAVLFAAWLAVRRAPTVLVSRAGYWAIGALGIQLLIALMMILKAFPLSLAAGHNAGAALLLMSMILLNRRLREA
jgi:cytochrome c oxidase assembly protein subunit 15